MNLAIFASGRGSNFSAIVRAQKKGQLQAQVALLVCDNPKAKVLVKAKRAKVKVALFAKGKDFTTKEELEKKIIAALEESNIELIVLAGFMRLLSGVFVRRFYGRIINIHPALLPAFKGAEGIHDAFEYGVKMTGVTVHFVDEEMDHGPIILQKEVKIEPADTMESLEAKIHTVEHRLYPEAIRLIAQGKIKIEGRKVRIVSGGSS